MNCDETQELLNSLIDNELPSNEADAVKAHLKQCNKCQHEHLLIADLHNTLSKVPRYSVPESLAPTVAEQIASHDEVRLPDRRWIRWAAFAATHVAAALFGVVIFLSVSPPPDSPTPSQDDVIAVHVRSLIEQNLTQVTSGDSHSVKPWFAGKIDYAPPVHDLQADGFPLIGGRIDQLNGHKVAVLVYGRRIHWINLFIAVAPGSPQQAERAQWNRNGYHAVSVQQGDFVYWAASDLSSDELEEFLQLVLTKNSA